MPKDTARCFTTNCYRRVAVILASSFKIVKPYSYYKKKGFQCVVNLATSYYAYYISVKARCSLVFSNTKRYKLDAKQRATKL